LSRASSPAERAGDLRRTIAYHDHRYYVLDEPEIGDDEYDALLDELRAIESSHPDLVTGDSPTQRVGGTALSKFWPRMLTWPEASNGPCPAVNASPSVTTHRTYCPRGRGGSARR
jgi:NAD-dependent DNA ligase